MREHRCHIGGLPVAIAGGTTNTDLTEGEALMAVYVLTAQPEWHRMLCPGSFGAELAWSLRRIALLRIVILHCTCADLLTVPVKLQPTAGPRALHFPADPATR